MFKLEFIGVLVLVFTGCLEEESLLKKSNQVVRQEIKNNQKVQEKNTTKIKGKNNSIQNGDIKGEVVQNNEVQNNELNDGLGSDSSVVFIGVDDVEEEMKGKGTKKDPYQIAHPKHFDQVRNKSHLHYKVVTSLNLSGIPNFDPLGNGKNSNNKKFTDTFDGGKKEGHIIKGLKIDTTDEFAVFFGHVESRLIQNVKLVEVDVKWEFYVGGLVGRVSGGGLIKNIWVSGKVEGHFEVGGIVGSIARGAKVEDSYSEGSVKGVQDVGVFWERFSFKLRLKIVNRNVHVMGKKANTNQLYGLH